VLLPRGFVGRRRPVLLLREKAEGNPATSAPAPTPLFGSPRGPRRRGAAGVTEAARERVSFHWSDPAWREGVDCHVGQNGENVGFST
jgi:hypothetical protein